eukprot:scaffold66036_cov27-Phaeocystis_antarctica.AAC.1
MLRLPLRGLLRILLRPRIWRGGRSGPSALHLLCRQRSGGLQHSAVAKTAVVEAAAIVEDLAGAIVLDTKLVSRAPLLASRPKAHEAAVSFLGEPRDVLVPVVHVAQGLSHATQCSGVARPSLVKCSGRRERAGAHRPIDAPRFRPKKGHADRGRRRR